MNVNHRAAPEPGLRCILAPNPSPMTYWGTNTYILGEGKVVVIDPGPADPRHFQNIMAALSPGETIAAILVTHAHKDHSGLSRELADAAQAPILAYGDYLAGRSAVMKRLSVELQASGGEGVDENFTPDEALCHGEAVDFGGTTLTGIWTPGHFGNHMCFEWQDRLFTGDLVMGWASTVVSPPDGDLGAYMNSLSHLARRKDRIYFPGHGPAITTPQDRAKWLIDHRKHRETQILELLDRDPMDCKTITAQVYRDTEKNLLPAAQRNVLAHLIDLTEQNKIAPLGKLAPLAQFRAKKPA